MTSTTIDLAAFVSAGWDRHADHPREVAADLLAHAATLSADSGGAGAIVLAEHVWLAHLHDLDGLAAFLSALPPALHDAADTRDTLRRSHWVLGAARGQQESAAIPDVLRWRGIHNLWSLRVAQGRAVEAHEMLRAELPRALAHDDPAARRALASGCNNLAVELRLGRRGDAALDALMLALGRASRELWASAGTWVHVERADYQLAHCHAVLGDGDAAVAHAQACWSAVEQHAGEPEADAFERFFAHEAMAVALRTAGHGTAAGQHRQRMEAELRSVTDADQRAWCTEALCAYDAIEPRPI